MVAADWLGCGALTGDCLIVLGMLYSWWVTAPVLHEL